MLLFFKGNSRLGMLNEFMLFLAFVSPFVVTDALARVIFLFEMEDRRLRLKITSQKQQSVMSPTLTIHV